MNARQFAAQVAVGVAVLIVVDWLRDRAARPQPQAAASPVAALPEPRQTVRKSAPQTKARVIRAA